MLDGQPLDIMSNVMSPHLSNELLPSPIMMSDSHRKLEVLGSSSQDDVFVEQRNQLDFLDRDLTPQEIESCELATHKYIQNDSYEIEIHNLNEINEYFRIFKDIVKKKDKQYFEEQDRLTEQVLHLQYQLNMLNARMPAENLMSL